MTSILFVFDEQFKYDIIFHVKIKIKNSIFQTEKSFFMLPNALTPT